MKTMYILWTCNAWKGWGGARIYTLCGNLGALLRATKRGIEEGCFEWVGNEAPENTPLRDFDDGLKFGMITEEEVEV